MSEASNLFTDEQWLALLGGKTKPRQSPAQLAVKRAWKYREHRFARLEAIVDKLPKYADTGEVFIPGADEGGYAIRDDGLICCILAGCFNGAKLGWGWIIGSNGASVYGPAYSTREAAEAARVPK